MAEPSAGADPLCQAIVLPVRRTAGPFAKIKSTAPPLFPQSRKKRLLFGFLGGRTPTPPSPLPLAHISRKAGKYGLIFEFLGGRRRVQRGRGVARREATGRGDRVRRVVDFALAGTEGGAVNGVSAPVAAEPRRSRRDGATGSRKAREPGGDAPLGLKGRGERPEEFDVSDRLGHPNALDFEFFINTALQLECPPVHRLFFTINNIYRENRMSIKLRSATTTEGRRMAGARSLWRANGMKESQIGKPIIAVVNSFTQFVPGHVHLHEIGQHVKRIIEEQGCFAAEFNTIAIDDGIAMGHNGMLYSLPSRELIADSVEYMCNAHMADAMICISNCDKITPGMLMAAMRLNIPAIFVSGGPMEAGVRGARKLDLIDAMVLAADSSVPDEEVADVERAACPTCGSCSGLFTANSMNCLTEALGLALPGNGTIMATHRQRLRLFEQAARRIVALAQAWYDREDATALPRSIATRQAFLNAMAVDLAMGGSSNTVLHLLAVARSGDVDFTMKDIDELSRKVPVLCKVAPSSSYHIEDVHRAGGVVALMGELARNGFMDVAARRVDAPALRVILDGYDIMSPTLLTEAEQLYRAAPGGKVQNLVLGSQETYYPALDLDRKKGCIRDFAHPYMKEGGLTVLYGNIARQGCIVKTAGVSESIFRFSGTARVYDSQEDAADGILKDVQAGDVVVIRYEGPRGGPGMQEMLYPTAYLKSRHIDKECALITDGRFSGGTSGLCIGHVAPEAAAAGEIGLLRTGDPIDIDIPARTINVRLTPEELAKRRREEAAKGRDAFKPVRSRVIPESLKAYAMFASSADQGAVRVVPEA